MNQRIYKYDNVKAILILLVVIGHMTTDYVSDSHLVRWTTLWIYTFHMPAFIFISGLVHKHYITQEKAALGVKGETRMRWDKVWGFFLCGYGLKIFLQFTRTLMGQNPLWHWIAEPGIPWYLFVMAEYEMLFYFMRKINDKVKPPVMIAGAFVLSSLFGYLPIDGDVFCIARMVNFLPIYMIGYYLDMKTFAPAVDKLRYKVISAVIVVTTLLVCYLGPWSWYSWRKWFTGRRSYEFLTDFFEGAVTWGWAIRPAVWAYAIILSLAIIILIPDKHLGYVTIVGERTLNIYFWHRPVCYLFRNWAVLPKLCVLFGGTYNAAAAGQAKGLAFGGSEWSMVAAFIVYCIIGAAMTAFFALKIFEHPCKELMKLGAWIDYLGKKEEA